MYTYKYGDEQTKPSSLKNRLRIFVNRVLRRIFGAKRDHVIGGWRKLHSK
jgi:hypothetical protein